MSLNEMIIPETVSSNKLLEYTPIDERHRTSDSTTIEIAGAVCGPANFLAICQDEEGSGYYLFFCDKSWREWNDMWFDKISDVKNYAEQEYIGSIATWKQTS